MICLLSCYTSSMKRITLLLIVLMLSFSLTAATSMAMMGISGGYSSTAGGIGTLNFNATAQHVADLSNRLGIGGGVHVDLGFGLNKDGIPINAGFMTGIAFEFRIGQASAINLTLGPALMAEAGDGYSSVGFGIGLDMLYTYYFDKDRTIGLSVGGTVYPQFLVSSDPEPSPAFSISGMGYVGVTWRLRGFSLSPIELAPLAFMIY